MIIVRLTGGIGNQMFQYAFGRAASTRLGEQLFLDRSYYRKADRQFLLDELNVSYPYFSRNRWFMKAFRLIRRPKVKRDRGWFEPENLEIVPNTILEGNWESPKYFKNIEDIVKAEFTLKNPSPKFEELARNIDQNSIAVHVRRGDYLVPHGKYLNGYNYYNSGVSLILEKKNLSNPKITIFSDDPEWCRKELSTLGGKPTEVFREKMKSDTEELILMSLYGHFVISNSTYSWWAAYLNKNPDKMVTMPENWFTEKERNLNYRHGLAQPGWIILS